jgi:Tfp pilus assembly protein PilO
VSQRDKILVAVAASVAALLGGWFVMAKPKRADMRTLDTQIEAKRGELAGVSARAAQYRAARESLTRNPQAFRQANKALPNRVAMSELLRTLSRTADGTGVTMSDLSTGAGETGSPGITSVDLSLNFDGSFLELQRFLAKLQKFVKVSKQRVAAKGRLLALNGITLSGGAPGSTILTAKVSATAYILQPGALSVGATAPATGATTPTPTPAPGATASTPTTTGAATP